MAFSLRGFVGSKILTIGIIAVLVSVAAFTAKRFNVGENILGSLTGFASTAGKAVTQPFTTFVSEVTSGASALGEASKQLSEGFQKSVSQTLGGGFNVFTEFGNIPKPYGDTSYIPNYDPINTYQPKTDFDPSKGSFADQFNAAVLKAQQAARPMLISKADEQSRALELEIRKTQPKAQVITQTNLPDATRHFYIGLAG